MENKTSIIRNVTFMWPKLTNAHSPFGTLQWDIMVVTDNQGTKEQLELLGVKMKDGKDGWYANIKRKAQRKDGSDQSPPLVLDANKAQLTDDQINKMGNGSKGHIKLFSYNWDVGGRSGTSAMLVAIQVTEYLEYEGSLEVDF